MTQGRTNPHMRCLTQPVRMIEKSGQLLFCAWKRFSRSACPMPAKVPATAACRPARATQVLRSQAFRGAALPLRGSCELDSHAAGDFDVFVVHKP